MGALSRNNRRKVDLVAVDLFDLVATGQS